MPPSFFILALGLSMLLATTRAQTTHFRWEGDVSELTLETLSEKYEVYILEDRAPKPLPFDRYIQLDGKYLTMYVDDKAIFEPNYDAETSTSPLLRTDLVKFFEAPKNGTMFYSATITVRKPFVNSNSNQVWFLEPDEQGSNLFHMAVDATESKSKPTFRFTVRSFENVVWSMPVELNKDNKFGVLVNHDVDGSGIVYLYHFEDDVWKCVAREPVENTTANPELHVGILVYGTPEPTVVDRDEITFSDVAVHAW